MQAAHAYLAPDRLRALASGEMLPLRATGTLLSVDIAGFTPLTAAYVRLYGARVGADNLALVLNAVYTCLLRCVDATGGSAVNFSGDAVVCWFAGDSGRAALACAQAMQHGIEHLPLLENAALPGADLAIKVTLAAGSVRRFVLGDPTIQRIDTLGGSLTQRLAALERLARSGEILVDAPMVPALDRAVQVLEQRRDPESGCVAAVVAIDAADEPTAARPQGQVAAPLPQEGLMEWLLPLVWQRLAHGNGEFLTEIRPAVALFWSLPDFDLDAPQAEASLDSYVCWAQRIVAGHAGVLLQVTLGEKGNYAYAAFGAPIAHEDYLVRAVATALMLGTPPDGLALGQAPRIGLAAGIMRTGAYGGPNRRTYGVLGDAVNLAARLMQAAAPDRICTTSAIQAATSAQFDWQPHAAILLKGSANPIAIWTLESPVARPSTATAHAPGLPVVGRIATRSSLASYLRAAQSGSGQLLALTGEAGIGKSRLAGELMQHAREQGWQTLSSEAQSYLTATPFLVWQPILRDLFGLTADQSLSAQIDHLRQRLHAIDPAMVERLPLLGPALNLEIPPTPLTQSFDVQLGNTSREALLVDYFRAVALRLGSAGQGMVVILDDMHWGDVLSWQLATAIGRALESLPVLLILISRPVEAIEHRLNNAMVPFHRVELGPLLPPDLAELLAQLLTQHGFSASTANVDRLIDQIGPRVQGNPFYLEELLNYVIGQGDDPCRAATWQSADLPTSLHLLVLSRIDQLLDTDQLTLKLASIIGRLFQVAWLSYLYPPSGTVALLNIYLKRLQAADLVLSEQDDPGLVYLFKHVIIREVAYESLAASTRSSLHQALAAYLEEHGRLANPDRWYVLAYHYERSANHPKAIEYLRLAAAAAKAAYANEAAVGYYQRLGDLLTDENAKVLVLLDLGSVLGVMGSWDEEEAIYRQALEISTALGDIALLISSRHALGAALQRRDKTAEAIELLRHVEQFWAQANNPEKLSRVRNDLLIVLLDSGQVAEAQQVLALNLAASESAGSDEEMMEALYTAAHVARFNGEMDLAIGYIERSIALAIQLDNQPALSNSLHILGLVYLNSGAYHQAQSYIEQALEVDKHIGDQIAMSRCYGNLAAIFSALEEYARATAMSEKSLLLARQLDHKLRIIYNLVNLGFFAMIDGDFASACSLYAEALAICRQISNYWTTHMVLVGFCHVLFRQGSVDQAWICVDEALAMSRETNNDHNLLQLLLYLLHASLDSQAAVQLPRQALLCAALDQRLSSSQLQLEPYDRALYADLVARLEQAGALAPPSIQRESPTVLALDQLLDLAASLNPAR